MDFYEVVRRRSAIRNFKPDPIPDDVVRRILDAGMHAPSGEHNQPWEFILIRNAEVRKRLAELKYKSRLRVVQVMYPKLSEEEAREKADQNKRALETAPVLIAVCYRNMDYDVEVGDRKISFSHSYAWQCIENMWLAAAAEGLGFSPTIYTPDVYDEVKQLLGLPKGVELAAVLRIGKKNQKLKRKPIKPLDVKLHYDKF